MKTTMEHFGMDLETLVQVRNEYGFTKEECLLYDSGLEIVFFDSMEEMEAEKEEFEKYIESREYEIKEILLTINERIAIVLN